MIEIICLGNVSVEVVTLELISNVLKRVMVTLVPLQTQVSCCALSENEERVVLGCIDGSVAVLNRNRGSTRTVKAAFIPKFAVWHKDNALMAVSNEKGRIQYFDAALNAVQSQLVSEEGTVNGILDLSSYMKTQPTIDCLHWGASDLLVVLEQGTLVIVSNVDFSLNFTSLAQRYISEGKLEKAIALLLSWEFNHQSYYVLQKICIHLMKLPLTEENAQYLQDALGSFHSPPVPISTPVRHKFGAKVIVGICHLRFIAFIVNGPFKTVQIHTNSSKTFVYRLKFTFRCKKIGVHKSSKRRNRQLLQVYIFKEKN